MEPTSMHLTGWHAVEADSLRPIKAMAQPAWSICSITSARPYPNIILGGGIGSPQDSCQINLCFQGLWDWIVFTARAAAAGHRQLGPFELGQPPAAAARAAAAGPRQLRPFGLGQPPAEGPSIAAVREGTATQAISHAVRAQAAAAESDYRTAGRDMARKPPWQLSLQECLPALRHRHALLPVAQMGQAVGPAAAALAVQHRRACGAKLAGILAVIAAKAASLPCPCQPSCSQAPQLLLEHGLHMELLA